MMEKRDIFFKQTLVFKGVKYLAGFAYKLELEAFEFDRLTRMGCIYADKNAKYYQEEKPIVEVEAPKKRGRKNKDAINFEVKDNVDNQDIEQAEIQADYSAQN